MDDSSFDIRYAAHTSSCTFLMDANGICRAIVIAPTLSRRGTESASRCVGAQYVASLDPKAAGGIIEAPKVGTSMLFAKAEENGRISLIRTGTVRRFEARDPVLDGDETPTPRMEREPVTDPYSDPTDRTVPVQALRLESGVDLTPSARNAVSSEARPTAPPGRRPTLRDPKVVLEDDDSFTPVTPRRAACADTPRQGSRLRRSR